MNDISLYEKIPDLENSFPVKIRHADESALHPHWHEHTELLFFRSGSCSVTCDGTTFTASAGDLVTVNRNRVHSFTANAPTDYFYIILYPAFFADVNFENTLLQTLVRGDRTVSECIEEMHREYTSAHPGSDMQLKSLAYRLIVHLMREYPTARLTHSEHTAQLARLERLSRVMSHISEHFHERITTAELAGMCFFSESHFCRFFKNAIGVSPTAYINHLRCEKAALMLKNTDESIGKIAEFVSFDDANYFSRVFKKIMGISPAEYRMNK